MDVCKAFYLSNSKAGSFFAVGMPVDWEGGAVGGLNEQAGLLVSE